MKPKIDLESVLLDPKASPSLDWQVSSFPLDFACVWLFYLLFFSLSLSLLSLPPGELAECYVILSCQDNDH